MLYGTVPELVTGAAAGNCQDTVGEPVRSGRNRWFVDSPLERAGFELLVRGRGEAGCRAFDAPSYLGRVGSRRSDPANRDRRSREQIPVAVFRVGRSIFDATRHAGVFERRGCRCDWAPCGRWSIGADDNIIGAGDLTTGRTLQANVLLGGSSDTISLQPVSIEGGTGLNIAGGFASMSLTFQPS